MLLVGSPLVNFVPPSELRAFRPACFPPGLESRPGVHRNLSPEVCSPSSARVQSVHHSRPCLSRCVPPAPFLTTSAACSAPHRPRISLGGTHGVFSPFRVAPVVRWAPPSPVAPAPLDLASAAPRFRGRPAVETTFCVLLRRAFRVFPARRPYPSASSFPSAGDRPPLGFLFRTSLHTTRRRRSASGPHHVPTCQ